jgi:phospholipid/cholesterol/gamma-HCH transport system permease protein
MTVVSKPTLIVEDAASGLVLRLNGAWITSAAVSLNALSKEAVIKIQAAKKSVTVDLSGVEQFDTAGALNIAHIRDAATKLNLSFEMTGPLATSGLLKRVLESGPFVAEPKPQRANVAVSMLEGLGRAMHLVVKDFAMGMDILGSVVRGSQMRSNRKSSFSLTPIVAHIDRMGVGAVPIVLLMSFIIGAIIAQQGAFQLRFFGAEIYVVDLVGILVLREIGVLITAIMVAGRSGSAITAEIGSMKMREEVDALTVIGLNPVSVLVFPRLVALVIALPLLSIIANFAALGGAALVASIYSGISFEAFIARLREAVDLSSVLSGLIKAPFMAMIIGIIAAIEGLKVQGSAESLGLCVTRSVVKSIFVVIVVDGLFAIFYAAIDF